MDNSNSNVSSSLFTDNNGSVMSAVASLLARQHHIVKEEAIGLSTPMLVLTNTPGKDALEASVVLGSNHGTSQNKSFIGGDIHSSQESLVPSFEQVHALATANLLASTQRDIAQQLAEANTISTPDTVVGTRCKKKSQGPKKKVKDKKDRTSQCNLVKENEEMKPGIFENKAADLLQPKALECSFKGCNRKFAWLTHLKYHELTHTNNRQFECPDENCGKTFFTAQRLKVHLRTHTGERPFKCSQHDCGKTFTTAGNLKNHERIHTGEQPFVCDYVDCKRRFTEYSSLHKHKLTHSGDKPFKCKVCDKKFTQSGSRRAAPHTSPFG